MRKRLRGFLLGPIIGLAGLSPGLVASPAVAYPAPVPSVVDFQWLSSANPAPSEAMCNAVGRRCFSPQAIRASYNIPSYADSAGTFDGHGMTIGIVDSYGSLTIANDLHAFDQAFGVPALCGETDVTCTTGMPWFKQFSLQGSPAAKPTGGAGTGQENHEAWSVEVSLDVEWAHAIAPAANILLITTPTAETLGLQGLPDMMKAEDYVIQHHMVDVISQSFGTGEAAFASVQSLLNLRYAYQDAKAAGVSVLASSGDDGSGSIIKTPVHAGGTLTPFPDAGYPASDPLVTAVGGTYLCTDPVNGSLTYMATSPTNQPAACNSANDPTMDRETGWIDAGGGFSHIFSAPSFQSKALSDYASAITTVPGTWASASTTMRGVPDVAFEASSRTGVLVYDSSPGEGGSSTCPAGSGCFGWYVVGGTSVSCPNWAGIVAIADQVNKGDLGYLNPALYKIYGNSAMWASDFFDVTHGNNGAFAPTVPGYPAAPGWDAVTGIGTPNVSNLVPDLINAVNHP